MAIIQANLPTMKTMHDTMNQLLVLLLLLVATVAPAIAADTMQFWDSPRHGANSFNRLPPDQAYFDALRAHGADWVRLSYDKWHAHDRDFLLGDADRYDGIAAGDLAILKEVLGRIEKAGLKAVIAPLSLPYARWSQNNGGKFDDRIWQERQHWRDAVRFWRDLAQALRGQPGIAAYNLINEPAPEKMGGLPEHAAPERMRQWYAGQKGSSRDLPAFYAEVIRAIREVDPDTPIMVDAGWYAAADAFAYWPGPLGDARTLYSFHMYEPYETTSGPNLRRKPNA
jgi:arabinogalactan endo-1,4-beta-galactosidase